MFRMQNGKPTDSVEQINGRNPNDANLTSAALNSTSQSQFSNHTTRAGPLRPQPRFHQAQANQQSYSPQQVRYINPVPRMPNSSNWHSTPPTPIHNSTSSNHSNNTRYLSATPRSVKTSTPKPTTTPISRSVTPMKPPIIQIKNHEDFIAKTASLELEVLQKHLAELLTSESDEEENDIPQLQKDQKAMLKSKLAELDAREQEIINETDGLKQSIDLCIAEQDVHDKFYTILETDEEFLPQTAHLPTDILVNRIEEENNQIIKESSLEHYEFEKKYNLLDHSFKNIHPGTDECVDENRPQWYEPNDLEDFVFTHESYRPFIHQLADLMADHREYIYDLQESRIEKYNELSREWNLKQEKGERNTRKIHQNNKNREIYEKSFPDIRRAREDKERNARSEKRPNAKQEAAAAQAEIDERKKVYGSAIIPPMNRTLFMPDQPKGTVIGNALERANENLSIFLHSWTPFERQTFQRKFLLYGKNFPAIATCIGSKSTEQCIRYFYLTKQHVKYKQLQKKPKRKKAGKQYKPTLIPTQGETMIDRIRAYPFMRSNKYVECLICEKKMDVFLLPKLVNGKRVTGEYIESVDDTLPICDACNTHIRKAKAANFSKCPLKSCALGGRKKAKPSRTIPDTANTLEIERRRFIIHHRKLHPEAVKCCGSCIRKIQNDFADLAAGKLNEQIAQFSKEQKLKKIQKENEGIPNWSQQEIVNLNECIKIFGIGNWYEVACRLNIENKTPFYCYIKHLELVKNGEWDKMFGESNSEVYEDEFDEEGAVDYLRNLVISNTKKPEMSMGVRVKQEVVTPPPEIMKMEIYPEEIPVESTAHLSGREKQLLKYFYLETIADMEEQYLTELLEKQYESDESEIPEDPGPVLEEQSIRMRTPKIEDGEDDENDIQVIQIVPPKKRQFGGSLTQGTPRGGAGLNEPLVPLPQRPTLSYNLGQTLGLQPPPSSSSHDTKGYEEQFRNFQENQLKELKSYPPPISQSHIFDNDLKALLNPVVSRNSGTSSSSSSITPIDQTATTTTPTILNFFTADVSRIRESPPSPNFPELIAPKNPLGTLLSPILAPPTRPPLLNWLSDRVASANGLTSLYEKTPTVTSVITQQQVQPPGHGFQKMETIAQSKSEPMPLPAPPTLTTPASFFSPGARKQHVPTEIEYPRKTATPDLKRKSGVETVCLPHASSHKSMHIKPHPSQQIPTTVASPSIPLSISGSEHTAPNSIPKSITPPPVIAEIIEPLSASTPLSLSASTITPTPIAFTMGSVPISLSYTLPPNSAASLNTFFPQLFDSFGQGINHLQNRAASVATEIEPKLPQETKVEEFKEEEMLPPPASPEPAENEYDIEPLYDHESEHLAPMEGLHIEVEPEPESLYSMHSNYEPLVTTVLQKPHDSIFNLQKQRPSSANAPERNTLEDVFIDNSSQYSVVSDSEIAKPRKRVFRTLSIEIFLSSDTEPESPTPEESPSSPCSDLDELIRIGESAMTPDMESEIEISNDVEKRKEEERPSLGEFLLASFDGTAPDDVRQEYHSKKEQNFDEPKPKKPRMEICFSDDEGLPSSDMFGHRNVTWMGDAFSSPPETRLVDGPDPFGEYLFKRSAPRLEEKKVTSILENDSAVYSDDAPCSITKMENDFFGLQESRGIAPIMNSFVINPEVECSEIEIKRPENEEKPKKKSKKLTKKMKVSKKAKNEMEE